VAQNDFAKLGSIFAGNALAKVTSLSMTTNSGLQRVDTIGEGLSGFTSGTGDVTIEFGFVIPIGGPEAEFQEHCANHATVEVEFFVGQKTYVGKGKVMTCTISQSVNQAAEGKCEWVGPLKPIEI
jgi:hypothetical protein